jgi:hypothetical protein
LTQLIGKIKPILNQRIKNTFRAEFKLHTPYCRFCMSVEMYKTGVLCRDNDSVVSKHSDWLTNILMVGLQISSVYIVVTVPRALDFFLHSFQITALVFRNKVSSHDIEETCFLPE